MAAASSKRDVVVTNAYLLAALNISFVVLAVIGQVSQNVSLPLWTGATSALGNPNCSNHSQSALLTPPKKNATTAFHPGMDPFFVLSFASLSFVIIFGSITTVMILVQVLVNSISGRRTINLITKEDDILFPQWQLILIGVFDALNGVFVVFASPPSRTAPFLQAILGNFTIPLTIIFRLILLRKKPTLLKFICAGAVLFGLVFSLIPVITGMDTDSSEGKKSYLEASRASQILWPLCFMFGFIPAALMNVIEEYSLKSTRKVNLFYLLFCTSFYQLVTVWALFWVDILPYFGFVDSVRHFGENYSFAFKCFFGGNGCNYQPGASGTAFIVMYFISYVGSGLLLRYSEGATYVAVVNALVTPLGALFWSICSRDECASFYVRPHADILTYFSIGGMVIMVPAIFFYNIGTFSAVKKLFSACRGKYYRTEEEEHVNVQHSEKTPLLTAPSLTVTKENKYY